MNTTIEKHVPKLITRAEFDDLTPRMQGYVIYMEAEWPGSELHSRQANPYPPGTYQHDAFEAGQREAVLEVQDCDE